MSTPSPTQRTSTNLRDLLARAIELRQPLIEKKSTQAFRIFSGLADGLDGVYIDIYGPGAALIIYEGRAPKNFENSDAPKTILELLAPLGVRAIYKKPFAKDRSKLGGELPACVTDPIPAAGEQLPESFLIQEHGWSLEIRLFDGLSTGLFLDQRDNRRWLANKVRSLAAERAAAKKPAPTVLNTFAYTCAFSVAAALAGAHTASVDVSGRYLDWGKRSFAHNNLDIAQHRFAKMDTFEFCTYARRKNLTFDFIVLDPPSFAAGSKKKGIRPWSSVDDYARLVKESAAILNPRGTIFASTNTTELCRPGRLDKEIVKGLGTQPRWLNLPPSPIDFARETERFAARAFTLS